MADYGISGSFFGCLVGSAILGMAETVEVVILAVGSAILRVAETDEVLVVQVMEVKVVQGVGGSGSEKVHFI